MCGTGSPTRPGEVSVGFLPLDGSGDGLQEAGKLQPARLLHVPHGKQVNARPPGVTNLHISKGYGRGRTSECVGVNNLHTDSGRINPGFWTAIRTTRPSRKWDSAQTGRPSTAQCQNLFLTPPHTCCPHLCGSPLPQLHRLNRIRLPVAFSASRMSSYEARAEIVVLSMPQ